MFLRRSMICAVLALAAIVATSVTATALEEHTRSGFFIGFGLGGGNAMWDWGANFDGDALDDSEGGGIGHFRIGGAVRDDLVLGLESSAWVKSYDVEAGTTDVGDLTITFSSATFAGTWFPQNLGWFVRGGIGFASAEVELKVDNLSITETDYGFAASGATGYEWRFTRKFAMGPQVEVFYLGIDSDNLENVLVVGGSLEFNWYW